jgi:flagellar basal-body rod modification protein FlgD
MAVGGINGALSGLATGGNSALNNVNFDTFLKLLVTQLKHQDPLNPMDGTEFTGQIAQFSSLEQQIRGNDLLEKVAQAKDYSQQALAVGFIGREALIPGTEATMIDGKMEFGYRVDEGASNVEIEILNGAGQVVHTIKGSATAGGHTASWDGKGPNGAVVATEGNFKLRISANNVDGKVIPSATFTYGIVTEVSSDGKGTTSIGTLDGRTSQFENILSVRAWQGPIADGGDGSGDGA